MKTLKVNADNEIPKDYTGVVFLKNKYMWWYKNGKFHREDGPAKIWYDGIKEWWLNGKYIYSSFCVRIDLRNKIILSKDPHPDYPTVQVWKWIDKNEIIEQVIISEMGVYIIE